MTIRFVTVGTHDYTKAFRKAVNRKPTKPNPKGNRKERRAAKSVKTLKRF